MATEGASVPDELRGLGLHIRADHLFFTPPTEITMDERQRLRHELPTVRLKVMRGNRARLTGGTAQARMEAVYILAKIEKMARISTIDSPENHHVLSSAGMRRVLEHDDRKFTFLVGDRKYKCNVAHACFLSPRVSRLLGGDSSVDRIFLDVDDTDGYFGEVLKLGMGESIYIDDNRCELVRQIGAALDNEELYSVAESQNVKLSSCGMRRIAEADQGEFRFLIGDREYECSVLKVCFLSPRVSAIRNAKIPSESGRRVCFGHHLQ